VKYVDLLIARQRDGKKLTAPKGLGVSLNFNLFDHFGGEIDALAKHAREYGADATGPINQQLNAREVTVTDPDGYKLIFTVPTNLNLGFDQMLEEASKEWES
jgi:uncharacterized glyoxalase superfamily protein PhnB